jgi:hypothetical protein
VNRRRPQDPSGERQKKPNVNRVLTAETQEAYDDFCSRSLARITSALERLIYIASTRDYNSGLYHHDGLTARFGAVPAAEALEYAHANAFRIVSLMPLRLLSNELENYMKCSREEPAAFLNAWQKLEPYRVAIPMSVEPTVAELFVSNVKIALAVVRYRLGKVVDRPSIALPPPSPVRQSLPQSRN